MVVQCPNCATKFRIADDKVTDKGVRVRCTSCKNVFQVRKSGTENAASQAQSGMTQELQAISFGPDGSLVRPSSLPPPRPTSGAPASKPASAPPPKPTPAAPLRAPTSGNPVVPPRGLSAPPPARPAAITPPPELRNPSMSTASAPGAIGRRRPSAYSRDGQPEPSGPPSRPRPSADDLFGMDELTGETSALPGSPLSSNPNLGRAPRVSSMPPPPPPEAVSPPRALTPPPLREPMPPPDEAAEPNGAVKLAAIKPARRDVFEGVDLATEPSGPISADLDVAAGTSKTEPPPAPPPDPSLQRPVAREMVAVALTGLIGLALALAVAAVAGFANLGPAWLRDGPIQTVVATQIATGLYDVTGEKPFFFVRGRVENRGTNTVIAVHVVADLVGNSGSVARAETIAGSEPTPEDVHALRSAEDAEAMLQKLAHAGQSKLLAPGESEPFFALITDPPADAERDEVRLRVTPGELHK